MYNRRIGRNIFISICIYIKNLWKDREANNVVSCFGEGDRNYVAEERDGRKTSQNSFLHLLIFELYECTVY